MKWSILVPTTDVRVPQFRKLMGSLLFQASLYSDIEVVAYFNRRTTPLGDIRQALVQDAKGEYVSFVDDDDRVHDNYISSIYPHLDGTNDSVGFMALVTLNDKYSKLAFNTLRVKGWFEAGGAYYRDVNYLCPVKRAKYRGITFRSQSCFEDMDWADQIRGKLRIAKWVNEVLYYYDCNYATSLTQNPNPDLGEPLPRLHLDHPRFRYHPKSER